MTDQYRLTVLSKQHQISFPVTRLAPLMDIGRAPIDSHTSLDAIYQAAAFASTPTALAFATRQVVSPAIVLGATDLRIDKPIDRFIADDRTSVLSLQSASDLGRRPALSQPLQDLGLKRRLTKQTASPPATAFSLLFSIDRLIVHFSATVAFEFTRYSRWRTIHSCRDFADCFPGLAIPGNRATLFQTKAVHIFVPSQHLIQKVLHFVCEFRASRSLWNSWIPARATPDYDPGLPGMTYELYCELRFHDTSMVFLNFV